MFYGPAPTFSFPLSFFVVKTPFQQSWLKYWYLHVTYYVFILSVLVSVDPQDHSLVLWFSKRTKGIQHIIVLTAMICCSEKIWSTISKEKTKHKLPESSSSGATQDSHRKSPSDELWPHRLTAKIPIQGSSCRFPLPGTYPNSRFSEGKLVFTINHSLFSNSGTVSHTYQLIRNLPEISVPRGQSRASLTSRLFKDNRSGLLC